MRMVRNRKRTTNRGVSLQQLQEGYSVVSSQNMSIRQAASVLGICRMTLQRFIKKKKKGETPSVGFKAHNRVLSDEMETNLSQYLIDAADAFHGLTPAEVRELTYHYAVANNRKVPESWKRNGAAGADWFTDFMKRNPKLSLRRPEATSLARAMGFNKPVVDEFFNVLTTTIAKHQISPGRIYNVDETGVTTVGKLKKIVAARGSRQVGGLVSQERGTLITMCLAVSSSGSFIPPMFLFPRLRYHTWYISGALLGSIGAANGSGWMEAAEFLVFLRHFIEHTKPSPENKVLLLLDNHSSHLQLELVELSREKGVVLLTLPPHTSHKLQPLDRSVYGPLKNYYDSGVKRWLSRNPGKRVSIYDIPAIVSTALLPAITPENIIAGFRSTGICPLNRDVFSEKDFKSAEVTNREIVNEGDPALTASPPCSSSTEHVLASPLVAAPLSPPAADALFSPATTTRPSSPIPAVSPSSIDATPSTSCVASTLSTASVDATPLTPSVAATPSTSSVAATPSTPSVAGPPLSLIASSSSPLLNGKVFIPPATSLEQRYVSPEQVRPHPKAEAAKQPAKPSKRVKIKSTVLTDTPEKNRLKEARELKLKNLQKPSAREKKKINKRGGKTAASKAPNPVRSLFPKDDDCFCLICGESFANSRPKEKWISCNICREWAHEECTTGKIPYFCHECVPE